MAASPFDTPFTNNSFIFDIFHDGAASAAASATSTPVPGRTSSPFVNLPGGPCGFVDLTPGANGARCGCRRFWSRTASAQLRKFSDSAGGSDHTVWCMCSHHACYHEAGHVPHLIPAPSQVPIPNPIAAGQENERPRAKREPLSPVQDPTALQTSGSLGISSLDFPGFNFVDPSFTTGPAGSTTNAPLASPLPTGDADTATVAAPDASLPDTLNWINNTLSEYGRTGLPPIPSQCLMPSQSPPSTTASSQLRYLRPFGGIGLNTLKGKGVARQNEVPHARDASGRSSSPLADDDAATNPNTQPSPRSYVPLPSAPTPKEVLSHDSDPRSIHSSMGFSHDRDSEALRNLKDTVQGHEQRIERLENISISVVGHDECIEKHDHTDLRVTELESRVEEVEKRLNDDNSTVASSHRRDDGSTASVTSDNPYSASEAEIFNRLQALQTQVNRLQASSLPTYNFPWELEVVILPFPLKGIWMLPSEFQSQRPSGTGAWGMNAGIGDEWTQLPNTHSRQTPDPPSPLVADWPGQLPSSDWLLPRACAPGRMIDERLRSRGLIKTLSVKGSDARSVHLAISAAFRNVLQTLQQAGVSRRRPSHLAETMFEKYFGLSLSWVPLRKLHKDSRLRFLTPAEMLTPTLWDAGFLMSSVVMKATGMHRLYITQPEAYVQDQAARENGWTWQRLRGLSPVCLEPDSSSASTISFPPFDECWQWCERLDDPPKAPSSSTLSLHQEQVAINKSRSTAASSSQLFHSAQSMAAARAKSPVLLRDRRSSRPPHLRTASVPLATPDLTSPNNQHGKARVSSYTATSKSSPYDRCSSPFMTRPSPRLQMIPSAPFMASMASKRRRTRSPSLRLRNTPRWSTTSMSRSPSLAPRGPSVAPEERVRGATPFCYATPYSTAPMEPRAEKSCMCLPHAGAHALESSDMDYEEGDGNHGGSAADPYDDHDMMNHGFNESFDDDEDDIGEEVDGDIRVYEDGSGSHSLTSGKHSKNNDNPGGSFDRYSSTSSSSSSGQKQNAQIPPEDEPWPGIEDDDSMMSDGENMDPMSSGDGVDLADIDDDAASDVSSQPSEYPSTQRAWHVRENGGGQQQAGSGDSSGIGFRIHEDDDVDVGGAGAAIQW